ncbi:unnamed protein product [Protopolystoma xenopodis]|uniref:Uncharacterized protein n=1 Tax=Protopolystoma xenopodis TaxID=117903 RepID=A0A448XF52_9PLAT|nr:unnamed protein product [Protopolystoma xenopodis]
MTSYILTSVRSKEGDGNQNNPKNPGTSIANTQEWIDWHTQKNKQIVLQLDKGGAMVVMDRKQDTETMERTLGVRKTYQILQKDPTMKFNGTLKAMLTEMHNNGEIDRRMMKSN